jgi:hypothetical protein
VKSSVSLVNTTQAMALTQREFLLPVRRITARAVLGPRQRIRRFPTACLQGAYKNPERRSCKQERPRRTALNRFIFLRKNWSGRRDSNPRPQPWQGFALPLSYTRILAGGWPPPAPAGDLRARRTG